MSLINRAQCKTLIREHRPGARISEQFLRELEVHTHNKIVAQLDLPSNKKTVSDFMHSNGITQPRERK